MPGIHCCSGYYLIKQKKVEEDIGKAPKHKRVVSCIQCLTLTEVDMEYLWMTNTLDRGEFKMPSKLDVGLTVNISQV